MSFARKLKRQQQFAIAKSRHERIRKMRVRAKSRMTVASKPPTYGAPVTAEQVNFARATLAGFTATPAPTVSGAEG